MQKLQPMYYIWYASDGDIYAYTDDRKLAEAFSSLRRKKRFLKKKMRLSSSDLRDLHNYYPEAMLQWVSYSLGEGSVNLPVTKMEDTTVIHNCIQSTVVDIPLSASIDPKLFTKEIQDALAAIGYVDVWESTYAHGNGKGSKTVYMKPNYLQCFLTLYADTIEWGEGGSIYESLHVLSKRQGDT